MSHYASVACKRLERIGFGGKRQPRKPSTEDIDQARVSNKCVFDDYIIKIDYKNRLLISFCVPDSNIQAVDVR